MTYCGGTLHGAALHVVEHPTAIDRDHLRYETTIEDPDDAPVQVVNRNGRGWRGLTKALAFTLPGD
jgi:hypothetical protein